MQEERLTRDEQIKKAKQLAMASDNEWAQVKTKYTNLQRTYTISELKELFTLFKEASR